MDKFSDALVLYVAAWDAYQATKTEETARDVVHAAEYLESFKRDDLPLWPYDVVRHTTLSMMGEEGRKLADINEEIW